MKNKEVFLMLLFMFIFLINFISSNCNETQIDINSANISELDKIKNVGIKIAQLIIEARPFSSVDDLIKVKGIANLTLNEIKQQGLACVNEPNTNNLEGQQITSKEEIIEEENTKEKYESAQSENEKSISNISQENKEIIYFNTEPLSLTNNKTKSIKTGENKETLQKTLSLLGIITIILFITALILLKELKNRKNELN